MLSDLFIVNENRAGLIYRPEMKKKLFVYVFSVAEKPAVFEGIVFPYGEVCSRKTGTDGVGDFPFRITLSSHSPLRQIKESRLSCGLG